MPQRRSLRKTLDDLERRTRKVPTARIDLVRSASGKVAFSIGSGQAHVVPASEQELTFLEWLRQQTVAELKKAPVLAIGSHSRCGQWDAAIRGAVILAMVHRAVVRVYIGGSHITRQAAQDVVRSTLPPALRSAADEQEGHYRLGDRAALELCSIKKRSQWTTCDFAVVADYACGSRQGVERALEAAPAHVLAGSIPETQSEQWICGCRDDAHSARRLFRFRDVKKDRDINRLVDMIVPGRKSAEAEFWKSTGL